MKRRCRAFTLIELIIAMTVLAVLMGVMIPAFTAYIAFSQKKEAQVHGTELYIAASAAVDTSCGLHETEYTAALDRAVSGPDGEPCRYGVITNDVISRIQYNSDSRRDFDYTAGYRRYYSRGAGEAIMVKALLEGLGALDKDITSVEERLRFASPERPEGLTAEDYCKRVSETEYFADSTEYTCVQAGIIVCFAKRGDKGGEVIYTEYGDNNGYLVICVNPAWYPYVREKLDGVRKNPITRDDEKGLADRSINDPVVIVIKNGCYETLD